MGTNTETKDYTYGLIFWRFHLIFIFIKQVRPYPRKAFGDGEGSLTLNELGLNSKQEALYLELI